MKKDDLGAIPTFKTTNRQLAFALILAGCSLAPQTPDAGGPTQNLYTLGFLRHHKIGKGKPMEEGVKFCVAKRIPGTVTYIFTQDDTLQQAISAWDAMVERWAIADEQGKPPAPPEVDTKVVMEVLFTYFNSLESLGELPWFNTPWCSDVTSRTETKPIHGKPAPRTTTTGEGRLWTLGASQEIKGRLRV